jgi:TonB-dependent receptor
MPCTKATVTNFISTLLMTMFSLSASAQIVENIKPGTVSGVIRDENNTPLAGVSISVENKKKGTSTSVSGDFLLTLSPGSYTIIISSVGFESQKINEIEVKSGKETTLSLVMKQSKKSKLSDVVVTSSAKKENAAGLLQMQKNNASMTDGISAEQINKTPDVNAAQTLKRVSGVTIQNDKFVTIRGMSDRYNNVMINGSQLPSTEPNRRNFSFDIIPNALIDNIVVNKTASPDLPGEFTGGVVQISSKDVPTKNFIQVAVGTGFNTASQNETFVSFKRDKNAYLGQVDANRYWYGDGRIVDPKKYYNDYVDYFNNKPQGLRNTGVQILNRWERYKYAYSPVQNYQLTGGFSKRFENGNSIGAVGAITYLNEQLVEKGEAANIQSFDGSSERYKLNTMFGGLVNVAYKTAKHKIALKNLYNIRYSHQFDSRLVTNVAIGELQQRYADVTLASSMFQTRLEGDHLLSVSNIKLDWFADYIKLNREQPDTRYLLSRLIGTIPDYNFQERNITWGGMFGSVLNETRNNAGFNFTVPFMFKGEKQSIKFGYIFSNREADFDASSLRILGDNSGAINQYKGLPYHKIVSASNFQNGTLVYFPTYVKSGSTGDRYNGEQQLHAAYAMADVRFLKKFRAIGGLRYERNQMKVSALFYEFPNGVLQLADSTKIYKESDFLPSVNLIYSLNPKMNFRAAASKTLARPDFIERSPFLYYDFVEQTQVVGEQSLQVTKIYNFDLRYEYYPAAGEIISTSFFYKKFDKPVERFFEIGSPTNIVQYRNLYKATALGFEVDVRKSLSFISPRTEFLKKLIVSANFSYLFGEIQATVTRKPSTPPNFPEDTFYIAKESRPIQGLAPYIFNAGISYQTNLWGVNLAFNRSGPKIVNGGLNSSIVQYENSRNILDLQLNAKLFKEKMEIRFNIGDILNEPFVIYSNNLNKATAGGFPNEAPNNDPNGSSFNADYDFVNYRVTKGVNFYFNVIYKF